MDKVKKFWKNVVKEREEFWGSLFQKYEDENSETDITNYLDNTSQRINEMLKLAALGDDADAEEQHIIARFYEEQPPPDNAGAEILPLLIEDSIPMKSPVKKPEYIVEIVSDDEQRVRPLIKKFRLFEPASPVNLASPIKALKISSESSDSETSPCKDGSLNGTYLNNSVRICRRSKPSGTPQKRFRLA